MNADLIIETPRLIMRPIQFTDDIGMFELDSDPEVHRYLGKNPVKTITESRNMISFIRQQYSDNGIGRWAVIEKASGDFIGWSGLKLVKDLTNDHINYYDVGYRFIPRYWGKGYATESARASLQYAFDIMKLDEVFGTTLSTNIASQRALLKSGLVFVNRYDYKGEEAFWYHTTRQLWSREQKQ